MKKLLPILFLLSFSLSLTAQDDLSVVKTSKDEYKVNTLFSKKEGKPDITVGGFLELNAGYTKFGSKNVFLPGINMGVILNHNWSLGLSGSFIGNPGNLYYDNIYTPDYYTSAMYGATLVGGYGGGLLEYTAFPRSVVHFSVPVVIGAGYFAYIDDYYYGNNDFYWSDHNYNYSTIDWNVCFVVEPGIKVEFNILKMLRIGVSATYRYSPNLELVSTPDDLLNQFTGRFSVRFGKF
jgi:hypothetical protein